MRPSRTALALLLLGLAGLAPRSAAAQDAASDDRLRQEAELARVTALYEAGKYDECAAAGKVLLEPPGTRIRDKALKEALRVYYAACLIGSHRPEEANEPLRAAIRDNPQMPEPDSLVFPRPVVEAFLRVRAGMLDEIRKHEQAELDKARQEAKAREQAARKEAARIAALEALATSETVIERNSRWIAFLPFGVGQFQNRDTELGWIFLATEAGLAATAITALAVRTQLLAKIDDVGQVDVNDLNPRLQDWHRAFVISTYGFLGVAVAGIVEAQLTFKPQFASTRRRPLPEYLRRTTTSGLELEPLAQPGILGLGLRGRF